MIRFITRVNRMVSEPITFIGRCKGFHPNQCYSLLTADNFVRRPFNTIIDVGANYGYFAKPARWLYPSARILCFEPTEEGFDKLVNIDGISIFKYGLGDVNKEMIIYKDKDNYGNSSFMKPKDMENVVIDKSEIRRFDGLGIQIVRPCFVKIDAEGFELNIIKGFGKMLKDVDVIQFEYHFKDFFENVNKHKLSDIIRILERYGFRGLVQTEYHEHGCDLMFYKKEKII